MRETGNGNRISFSHRCSQRNRSVANKKNLNNKKKEVEEEKQETKKREKEGGGGVFQVSVEKKKGNSSFFLMEGAGGAEKNNKPPEKKSEKNAGKLNNDTAINDSVSVRPQVHLYSDVWPGNGPLIYRRPLTDRPNW